MHVLVNLLDGSHIVASVSGSIAVSAHLTMHNVLYIPNFHVNLIFVAKLVSGNNFYVHFNIDICHILQNHSKEIIGSSRLQRGLYMLDSTPQSSVYTFNISDSAHFSIIY